MRADGRLPPPPPDRIATRDGPAAPAAMRAPARRHMRSLQPGRRPPRSQQPRGAAPPLAAERAEQARLVLANVLLDLEHAALHTGPPRLETYTDEWSERTRLRPTIAQQQQPTVV